MFAAWGQALGEPPQFDTKKALLIINCQNDAFYHQGDFFVTKNPEFLQPLREMIPYFRKVGEIIWVRTEMGVALSAPSPDAETVERKSALQAEENQRTRSREEAHLKDDTDEKTRRAQLPRIDPAALSSHPAYDPSSRTKKIMTRTSADTRSEKRSANMQVFDDKDGSLEDRLLKPRKGQKSKFFIAGTKGAEICDELIDLIDNETDMSLTKHFYSAFDQTSLLTSLRMRLITEVYLCGGVTNASVYSTAADAVQHGLEVNVVEDCLGYRSPEKHEEALRQMADIMGVNQIISEEIIEESGGRTLPDAETPGITLQELSLSTEEKQAQASLVANRDIYSQVQFPTDSAADSATEHANLTRIKNELLASTKSRSGPQSKLASKDRTSMAKARANTLGPDDLIGSGDSKIVYSFLGAETADKAFNELQKEVDWQTMGHRGGQVPRLVAVQGEIGPGGEVPIYRHPADESPPLLPFTSMVLTIKSEVERYLKHPFNHALIQLYRGGDDNISEHADKTLDIVRGSSIVNVSLGAQRAMTLRLKRPQTVNGPDSSGTRNMQRIPMPHDSIFVLGPQSNREWLHGVRADKRPLQEKSTAEKAFGSERISITFRQIGTFLSKDERYIWGTGAKSKQKSRAARVSNGDKAQMDAMVVAFGKENHQADFDWDTEYGAGFDVVNLVIKQEKANLVLCSDPVANHRVQLALDEMAIPFVVVNRDVIQHDSSSLAEKPWIHGLANTESPVLSGLAPGGYTVEGDLAILIHLEKHYQPPTDESHQYPTAQLYSYAAQANELLYLWYELKQSIEDGRTSSPTTRFRIENKRPPSPDVSLKEELHATLKSWEDYLANSNLPFIAGDFWSVIDCAFWPVFNSIAAEAALKSEVYPNLLAYHRRIMERDSVKRLVGAQD